MQDDHRFARGCGDARIDQHDGSVTFGGSVAADEQSDARVLGQLERLRDVARSGDAAALGVEVERAAAQAERDDTHDAEAKVQSRPA